MITSDAVHVSSVLSSFDKVIFRLCLFIRRWLTGIEILDSINLNLDAQDADKDMWLEIVFFVFAGTELICGSSCMLMKLLDHLFELLQTR